ncbi:hypothetical protein [Arthrobacter sp. 4R501]|uniref:hypothetical protein n=1 Tax=Arthrobacter sp. 4R501 TaxID=2058886 RepID=UPI0015E3EE4A|nr:hypothetical protein [Arthrobacter sp. 4R501]
MTSAYGLRDYGFSVLAGAFSLVRPAAADGFDSEDAGLLTDFPHVAEGRDCYGYV